MAARKSHSLDRADHDLLVEGLAELSNALTVDGAPAGGGPRAVQAAVAHQRHRADELLEAVRDAKRVVLVTNPDADPADPPF